MLNSPSQIAPKLMNQQSSSSSSLEHSLPSISLKEYLDAFLKRNKSPIHVDENTHAFLIFQRNFLINTFINMLENTKPYITEEVLEKCKLFNEVHPKAISAPYIISGIIEQEGNLMDQAKESFSIGLFLLSKEQGKEVKALDGIAKLFESNPQHRVSTIFPSDHFYRPMLDPSKMLKSSNGKGVPEEPALPPLIAAASSVNHVVGSIKINSEPSSSSITSTPLLAHLAAKNSNPNILGTQTSLNSQAIPSNDEHAVINDSKKENLVEGMFKIYLMVNIVRNFQEERDASNKINIIYLSSKRG